MRAAFLAAALRAGARTAAPAVFRASLARPVAMFLVVSMAVCLATSFMAPAAICWNCWVSEPHHCIGSTTPAAGAASLADLRPALGRVLLAALPFASFDIAQPGWIVAFALIGPAAATAIHDSDPAAGLTFISPPLSWLLAIIALAYGGVRWRTLAMRERAQALEALVERRTHELSLAKDSAEGALVELKGAQRQLVAAEKMASLGQLVAGVAHEINTPVGIAITASSHLQELAREGSAKLAANRLSREDLARWKQEVAEAARLILSSLERAGALIASFKQVSVDRSSDDRRRFDLHESLKAVVRSLELTWKRRPVRLDLECDERIELDSYPGALGQVITNLIQNALLHAFDDGRSGTMRLTAAKHDSERVRILFEDDGNGIGADELARVFEPFYTTRRAQGGSGLGLLSIMLSASPLLVVLSSLASDEFTWKGALINAVVLTALSWVVFIKGLSLTIPLLPGA